MHPGMENIIETQSPETAELTEKGIRTIDRQLISACELADYLYCSRYVLRKKLAHSPACSRFLEISEKSRSAAGSSDCDDSGFDMA